MNTTTQPNNQAVQYIPLSKLEKSSYNVRKTAAGCDDLVANIKAEGMMYPLCVYAGKKGKYYVFAGGRRYDAQKVLQKEGHFGPDHEVACQVYPESEAERRSLAENIIRVAMHPADRFEAVNDLIVNHGMTKEEVATRLGCTMKQVEGSMRLARIAPVLIQHYRDEKMPYESLQAFAVVDDHEKQIAVYESLNEWQLKRPSEIRDALTEEMVNAEDKLVVFVGLEMYQAAGGAVRTDLTGETFLENPQMLDGLVDKKLKLEEAQLIADGWGWVQVDRERDWQATQGCSRLEAEPVDAPQELIDRRAALETELEGIEGEWDGADEGDDELLDSIRERNRDAEKKLDEIEKEIAALGKFTPDQMKSAGCYAYVGNDGKLEVEKGLVRRQDAKKPAQKAAGATDDDQPVEKPKGISESLKRDLEAYRLGAAKAEIAKHPAIAFDLLVFKAAKNLLSNGHVYDGPQVSFQRNYGGTASKEAREFICECVNPVLATLTTVWLKPESEADQFLAFQKLTTEQKHALLDFCVASTLQPKLTSENGKLTAYDIALSQTGANVADHWRPTKDNYLSRITTGQLLEIGQELFQGNWSALRKNTKKSVLVSELDKAFTKPDSDRLTAEQIDRLKNWLPAGMAFTAPAPTEKPAKVKKGKKAA